MNNLANELMDIADKAEAGDKLHWAKAMRAGALQLENWRRDLDRLNTELQKRDKCSYMGPMRDCPTHGESKDAARYRWLREQLMAADFDWQESGECAIVFVWPKDCAVSGNCDAMIDSAMLKTQNALGNRRAAFGASVLTDRLAGNG